MTPEHHQLVTHPFATFAPSSDTQTVLAAEDIENHDRYCTAAILNIVTPEQLR
jgi:hypothetical protein